jgi:hypothetical protein
LREGHFGKINGHLGNMRKKRIERERERERDGNEREGTRRQKRGKEERWSRKGKRLK